MGSELGPTFVRFDLTRTGYMLVSYDEVHLSITASFGRRHRLRSGVIAVGVSKLPNIYTFASAEHDWRAEGQSAAEDRVLIAN